MARIGIVGGGIIGSAASVWLLADGHDVTLFERDPDGLPASAGNAGLLALPEIEPLARPGVLFQVPRWLLDPLGPLTLRWRDAMVLAPWMLGFLRAAWPASVVRSTAALAALMRTALADHHELARRAGLSGHMRRTGAVVVFDRPGGIDAAMTHVEHVRRHLGLVAERLSADATRVRVPALEGRFAGAISWPDYWTVNHPLTMLRALRGAVQARGHVVSVPVQAVRQRQDAVTVVAADGASHPFDSVLVAGGVWSREIVRALGLTVLLETERGYNTTFENPDLVLPMPVFFADHGFVATPLHNALRVGGAVELAAPDAPANFARARAMRERMARYIPGMPRSGGVEWMGCRPSTPDSRPVISRHPADPRILFAFGHGHLGLTLSAVTARHIAGLITGAGQPPAELAPFDIRRFQRGSPS